MYVQTVVMPCRSGLCRRGTKYSHIYIYIYILHFTNKMIEIMAYYYSSSKNAFKTVQP